MYLLLNKQPYFTSNRSSYWFLYSNSLCRQLSYKPLGPVSNMEEKNMKKLLSMMAIAALVLTGCSKDLEVKTVDKLTVEYGDKLDNSKLFDSKESDKEVKVDKVNGFDTKKLGDQTLKVTFTDGDKFTEKEIKVTVKDTKKPEIVLKKNKITVTAGDKLVLKDNVKSVKDPVDGNLKYSEKEIKKYGYYIDKGKLDTKKAGTYEVKVFACDANGNTTEKSFKVTVQKKVEKKAATEQSSEATTSHNSSAGQQTQAASPSSPTNNNELTTPAQPSGGNGNPAPAPAPKPQTCTLAAGQIGNSGLTFKTYAEAEAWGAKEQESSDSIVSYTPMEMYDTCDNVVGYTLSYSYAK